MILDQPIQDEPKVVIKRWTWWEKVLPSLLFLVVIFREITGNLWSYLIILMLGALLAFSYVLAYYWIDRPAVSSFRTVLISILYGLSFSVATAAFVTLILFFPRGIDITYGTIILMGVTLLIDLATSLRLPRVANKMTFVRIGVFAVLLATLNLIPEHKHVEFTYRRYTGFVTYYKEHYNDGPFLAVYGEYRRINNLDSDDEFY
jgi:hypothetical protein